MKKVIFISILVMAVTSTATSIDFETPLVVSTKNVVESKDTTEITPKMIMDAKLRVFESITKTYSHSNKFILGSEEYVNAAKRTNEIVSLLLKDIKKAK